MSDESANPVVEPEVKEEVSPLAESTTPAPDVQVVEEKAEEKKPNPLEPGGDRFKQVWARAKQAEERLKHLEAEHQREREERIRLEERQKTKEEQHAQQEMTWAQLEAGIAEGKWSRDQAQEYKDKMAEQRLQKKLEQKQREESSNARILGEIGEYQKLVPDVMTYGSENRQKYEREFSYMVRTLGMPDNYATQLAAVRAAFGDPDTLRRKASATKVINQEPLMETHTPSSKKVVEKSLFDKLDDRSKKHYERLLEKGVYKNVQEVEEELKWENPLGGRR